jgi:DNA-binding NtrC family response regulator
LIVDDDEGLAFIIQQMLESEGYEVMRARNGADGYWIYTLFRPDLVITDIRMPEENGLEMMKHIRTHNPKIKTIYMSGSLSQFRSQLEEEKRHEVSFIKKPFSKIELMSLVSEHF